MAYPRHIIYEIPIEFPEEYAVLRSSVQPTIYQEEDRLIIAVPTKPPKSYPTSRSHTETIGDFTGS